MEDKLPRKTEKPWGYELLFALTPKYAGKVIFVKKGHRLSLQYHEKKDETLYIYNGKASLDIEGSDGHMVSRVVQPGESIPVSPFTRHSLEAIEDTIFLEASTPELDDVIRVEDDYGRASK